MLKPITIENKHYQVYESPDDPQDVRIIETPPELRVKRLNQHVIEVFKNGTSLGCFGDGNDAMYIPQECRDR